MTTPTSSNRRRRFLRASVAGILGGSSLAWGVRRLRAAGPARRSALRGLYPDGAPASDAGYSPGIEARPGRLVFVAGQGPRDLEADMETQMHQTFQRIGQVLEAAGASFADIVMMRSYFVHIERDLPVLRKVRREYLSAPYPASSAIGVPALAIRGLEIEIEAQAIVRD